MTILDRWSDVPMVGLSDRIVDALRWLVTESRDGSVVVQDRSSEKFVQFCIAVGDGDLVVDLPYPGKHARLRELLPNTYDFEGITIHQRHFPPGGTIPAPIEASCVAMAVLREVHGCDDSSRFRIIKNSGGALPGGAKALRVSADEMMRTSADESMRTLIVRAGLDIQHRCSGCGCLLEAFGRAESAEFTCADCAIPGKRTAMKYDSAKAE
jgi:hypothetical protein